MIYIIEDIASNFKNISELIEKQGANSIFDFYFGHLNAEKFAEEEIFLKCNCSMQRIKNMIYGLGEKEALDIIRDVGKIEVGCQFCGTKYVFTEAEVKKLWQE